MFNRLSRRIWMLLVLVPLGALGVWGAPLVVRAPETARAPATAPQPTATRAPITPTATSAPPATAAPTATRAPQPTAAPTVRQIRVGLQAGHWRSAELPDELARLRSSSGTTVEGHVEADLNLAVAQQVAALLTQVGIAVDVLPATVPPAYAADVFVAIHADGDPNGDGRGFKIAAPWRASPASKHLLDTVRTAYADATGLPNADGITFSMRGYYAFNDIRNQHAIAPTTPAVLLEMGFLTSAADRKVLYESQENVAIGIANGIITYLNERNTSDRAALEPPTFAVQMIAAPAGADLRAAPGASARVRGHVASGARVLPFEQQGEWLEVVTLDDWDSYGWVRSDALAADGGAP